MINVAKFNGLRAGHTAKHKVWINFFYYDNSSGNGDLGYNTCREIIDRDQNDPWAHAALEGVFEMLAAGMRWPDYMANLIDPTDQYRMSQDPWLLAYCCAVHLGREDLIEKYKPNTWLFFLDKWAWRRALLGKPNLYWLWRIITPHFVMQHFVYVFYGYMDQAYLNRKK